MADPPPCADSNDDAGAEPDRGTPRWVKMFGAIVIALVLVFLVLHLAGISPGGH